MLQSRLMFVKTRKYYYNKLCSNKYVGSTRKPNELNEFFRSCFENILIKTISDELTYQ